MENKKTIAFIFARGGSKGLPFKNELILCGHPLIAYSINLAKINKNIKDVYVSTDSKSIANIALKYGAKVINRPHNLSQDNSPELLAWKHAINYVNNKIGTFEKFISLPSTSPLRSLNDIDNCLEALKDNVDMVITITPSNRSPWFNMVSTNEKDFLSIICKGKNISRRQDAPKSFDITTVAYVSNPNFLLNISSFWEGKVKGVIIPKERALDIDDKFDFLIANYLIKERKDLYIKNFL